MLALKKKKQNKKLKQMAKTQLTMSRINGVSYAYPSLTRLKEKHVAWRNYPSVVLKIIHFLYNMNWELKEQVLLNWYAKYLVL